MHCGAPGPALRKLGGRASAAITRPTLLTVLFLGKNDSLILGVKTICPVLEEEEEEVEPGCSLEKEQQEG